MTPQTQMGQQSDHELDPVTLAVMASRFDAIVRDMTNTLLRSGRSAMIGVARDFSCALLTADNELISAAEGLPVHLFGAHIQTKAMQTYHPDLRPGDAFLDNDPYGGNSHHADHSILVPIFLDGQHAFTAVAKAHLADIGCPEPTTFMPYARDIYEEGALSFPCVQIQRAYRDIEDIIRICRRRIRVPELWYGDYLAILGAARIAERRLSEMADKFGVRQLQVFVREYLDYSERAALHAIRGLTDGTFEGHGQHDPLGSLPATPVKVTIRIDTNAGMAEVDLRECPDCGPYGINLSEATATAAALTGVFNNFVEDVPANSGSFRRIRVLLRHNCVAGIPQYPASCSLATTNVASRVANVAQAALAGAGGVGMAHGGGAIAMGFGVIAGVDHRLSSPNRGMPYINELMVGNNGGPATASHDGWLTWGDAGTMGLMYRDSIEILEQKYPIRFDSQRLVTDSGGAGCFRGGLTTETRMRPVDGPLTVSWFSDGTETPALGVNGGQPGCLAENEILHSDGTREMLPPFGEITVVPGQVLRGVEQGGGGSGNPMTRDPDAVLRDVYSYAVSRRAAEAVYGVRFVGSLDEMSLAVDRQATIAARAVPE